MKRSVLLNFLAVVMVSAISSDVLAQSGQRFSRRSRGLFTQSSVEQGWKSAVAEQKTLVVMFKSSHCIYCTKMLSETFGNPAIQRMLASDTETVLAKAEDYRSLIQRMEIRGYPTTLLISPQGEVLDLVEGFLDARAFAKRISPILAKQQAQRESGASTASIQSSTVGR